MEAPSPVFAKITFPARGRPPGKRKGNVQTLATIGAGTFQCCSPPGAPGAFPETKRNVYFATPEDPPRTLASPQH